MTKNRIFAVVALVAGTLTATLDVRAGEGFFEEHEIQLPFSLQTVRPASLLVEEVNLMSGSTQHVGNAFYVTKSGYALTNFHIARACLMVHKNYVLKKYGSLTALFRQGFVAESLNGLPCPSLKVTGDYSSVKRLRVSLVYFPPITEQPPVARPQERIGPIHDFAVLKVHLESDEAPLFWLDMKKKAPSAYAVGKEVYLVGYPAYTRRADESEMIQTGKYRDVATGDYRVSNGDILTVDADYLYQPNKHIFIYTSTDGGPGSSGSALLDENGELLGLIQGSGDANSSSAHGCNMRLKYCEGGVSLYIKVDHIIDSVKAHFKELAELLLLVEKN